MKPQEQFPVHNAIRNAINGYRYTPGKPDDSEMIRRLTDKAFALALSDGEVLSRREARQRAMENLAWVRALAGAKEVAR